MTEESNMVNVYLMGKKYEVPEGLTIMGAMEYAGYKLVRGCGCRNGFCGACATVYRIKGERELHAALACQTTVQENMYIATLPFFPLEKQVYDINEIKPDAQVMMQLYPEIYSCIGCNACTNACTQSLDVMQYIAAAQRGDFKTCAELSFDCVMCGVCSSRCPAGISHPQVAELARRLNGKYIAPEAKHLTQRVKEIQDGLCEAELEAIMAKPVDELKELYNHRVIEK
jgi:succinate dehydrogenase/fumarate reductase-like Fe-S protein